MYTRRLLVIPTGANLFPPFTVFSPYPPPFPCRFCAIFLPSNPGHLVPCTLDNVGTILCYQTSNNIKCVFNKRHFFARSLFYYVWILCLCFMRTCVYCMNCFSSITLCVCMLSCVNMCACRVFYNKLTYLLTYLGSAVTTPSGVWADL